MVFLLTMVFEFVQVVVVQVEGSGEGVIEVEGEVVEVEEVIEVVPLSKLEVVVGEEDSGVAVEAAAGVAVVVAGVE